jgi:predicted membrane-bound mannosyltransferase
MTTDTAVRLGLLLFGVAMVGVAWIFRKEER